MVERVNNFNIKKYSKNVFLIIMGIFCIFIISGGYRFFNDYRELKKKNQAISSYEKKYKELLGKYNRVVPYEKLYGEATLVNQDLNNTNSELVNDVGKYKSPNELGNKYVDFKEDIKGNLEYISESYGVSLIFPHSWENKLMIQERLSYYDSNKDPSAIYVYDKESYLNGRGGLFFTLFIFNSTNNWNSLAGVSFGVKKLYHQGEKVIACQLGTEQDAYRNYIETFSKEYLDMSVDVENIIKTLKVY